MSTTHEDGTAQEATVHYLHAVREDTDNRHQSTTDGTEVVEGELLTEAETEEYRRLTDPKLAALDRYEGYKNDLIKAGRGVRFVATHQRTKSTVQFLARHGYFVTAGTWDVVCDGYKRVTHRDMDERIAAAQRDGEHGIAAQLQQQKNESRKILLDKWRVFGAFLLRAPIGAGLISATVLVVTLVCSVVGLLQHGVDGFTSTWAEFGHAIATGWDWASFAASTLLPGATVIGLAGLVLTGYNRRRRGGDAPAWARPADAGDGRAVIPTEEAILDALRHLGISKLNEAFKNGWGTTTSPSKVFESPTVRDGRGYRTQIILPKGVDVEMVVDRKNVLAHNLTRFPSEVWPTVPKGKAGVMDLWVADQNVLGEPAGKPPWLAELDTASTDYFTGVPVGKDIRGETVHGLLFEANYATAGMMGSGKSSLILDLVAGAALDPLVDIDCFVLAENADYEPLRPRLSTLCTGPGEDVIEAAVAKLQALWDDLEPRGQALKDHGNARKSSRELAEKDDRLRPRILVLDECQNLFTSKKYGEWAADMAYQLISTARKYGVTLILATPEPSTDSLPRKMMSIISNKACFAIGDQRSNDAILGTGSYKQGITATDLEPKTVEGPGDVGTAMARGFKGKPGLVRTFYIDEDEMARVATRAQELVNGTGGVRTAETTATTPHNRDLLEDLDRVLGSERANAADVPALLRDLDPAAARYYEALTGRGLVEQLAELGVKCPNVSQKYKVLPDAVRGKLTEQRAAADEDVPELERE